MKTEKKAQGEENLSSQTRFNQRKSQSNSFFTRFLFWITFLFLGFLTVFFFWYLDEFNHLSGLTLKQAFSLVKTGFIQSKEFKRKDKINFLVLGLDRSAEERFEDTLLTDTIIFFSFSPQDKTLKSFSIPRDLWFAPLKTKINALYYYGEKENPGFGPIFTKEKMSEILDQPIDFYVAINFSSLKDLANILGGVLINVERSFTDSRYPLPHPEKIKSENEEDFYEEIHFDAGLQLMDGETLLKFVRSRNSSDKIEGSDLGRSQRQQLVFKSILNSMAKPNTLLNPQKSGRIYEFYQSEVITNLTEEGLIGLGFLLFPSTKLKIKPVAIPVAASPEEKEGAILYHPPVDKYGLWVLEPTDEDFSSLQQFIARQIKKDNHYEN